MRGLLRVRRSGERMSRGHALLPPDGYEPYRCRCGKEYDWSLSENNPGGITRREARDIHRFHLQDVWLAQAKSASSTSTT